MPGLKQTALHGISRVGVGSRLLRQLVFELDPNLQKLDRAEARDALHRRGVRLSEAIGDHLAAAGNLAEKFVWQPDTRQAGAWLGFKLGDGNWIELVMRWTHKDGPTLEVEAYPERPRSLYPDFDHLPLGLEWKASDDEMTKAFLGMVRQLQEKHPRST